MKQMINMFWAMICAVALFIGAYPASASEDMVRLNIPCHITPKYKELFPEAQRFVDRINELGKGRSKPTCTIPKSFLR